MTTKHVGMGAVVEEPEPKLGEDAATETSAKKAPVDEKTAREQGPQSLAALLAEVFANPAVMQQPNSLASWLEQHGVTLPVRPPQPEPEPVEPRAPTTNWNIVTPLVDPDPRPILERFAAKLATVLPQPPIFDRYILWASAAQAQIRADLRMKTITATGQFDWGTRTGYYQFRIDVEPIPGTLAPVFARPLDERLG